MTKTMILKRLIENYTFVSSDKTNKIVASGWSCSYDTLVEVGIFIVPIAMSFGVVSSHNIYLVLDRSYIGQQRVDE